MPTVKWIVTARDPLWVASMQERYIGMARRASMGMDAPGDDSRLTEALQTLRLSRGDFRADVDSLRSGEPTERLRGIWPDYDPLNIQEQIDHGDAVEHRPGD